MILVPFNDSSQYKFTCVVLGIKIQTSYKYTWQQLRYCNKVTLLLVPKKVIVTVKLPSFWSIIIPQIKLGSISGSWINRLEHGFWDVSSKRVFSYGTKGSCLTRLFTQQTEKEKFFNTIGSITAYALSIQGELTETFFLAQGDWESPYVKGKQGLYK